ncbi:hypothetical protein [Hymenobacter mucosus]|uniref:Uncharacterized protein n=1 Tax=Hymenobacter mucosus TaxID=1411120 RepID=A0A239BFB3_9BACT|nr:hypothetical protein [Hymenobacter mucosus]SNS06735.1 hypothetical protein SAMN06269173_12316 [Hymenobacter mucosus]
MPAESVSSALTAFLQQLDSPAFQDAMRAQLRAEAAAANTFLSYRDTQGRYVHEYPATGEVYGLLMVAGDCVHLRKEPL